MAADPLQAVYQALCHGLKEHPDLRTHVRTWRFRDRSAHADEPPTLAQCPWVRLTPVPRPVAWHDRTTLVAPLGLAIETAVDGGFPASAALWGRLLAAIVDDPPGQTNPLRAALADLGLAEIRPESPALPAGGAAYDARPLLAAGSIVVPVYLRTR